MRKPVVSTAYSPAKHDAASITNPADICATLGFSIMETSALMSPAISNTLTHLECGLCSRKYESGKIHNLCECGGPLLVRYDLEKLSRTWSRDQIAAGPNSMWRYGPALPPTRQTSIISLGEGMTPLVRTARLGARIGAQKLWIKDEGLNPTGSFKARGLSCAVSMAVELGIRKLAIRSEERRV